MREAPLSAHGGHEIAVSCGWPAPAKPTYSSPTESELEGLDEDMNASPATRLPATIIMMAGLLTAAPGLAADSGHSLYARRQFFTQVVSCMRKRMAVDKAISYNQAAKVCKEEVTRQGDGSNAGPLVAADTKH